MSKILDYYKFEMQQMKSWEEKIYVSISKWKIHTKQTRHWKDRGQTPIVSKFESVQLSYLCVQLLH